MWERLFHINSAAPEIWLLGMICVILLVDVFSEPKQRSITFLLTQVALIGVVTIPLCFFDHPPELAFSGHYIEDRLTILLTMMVGVAALISFQYGREYVRERPIPQGEYYVLALFSVLGMLVLISAHSLLIVYLGVELLSLPLYAILALHRSSQLSPEAAIKYFAMGAVASGMLLYGFSMIYGATLSLDIDEISKAIVQVSGVNHLMLVFGMVFIVAGLAFKFGAVPFHMWVPDVYSGAPSSVTLFIGSVPKIAAVGMALRVLVTALQFLDIEWQQLLIVLAILSVALGNIVAIVQTNIKRMLAFSAIAHMGYLFLGLLSVSKAGYSAAVFYVMAYSLMSLGALGMVVLLSRAGFEAENIDDFRGLHRRNPWMAFMMMVMMLSIAGIPPTVGFFAKFAVLAALVEVNFVWLAVLVLLFSIVGCYYAIVVVKVMYFEEPAERIRVPIQTDVAVLMSINGLAILFFGLYPTALINTSRWAVGM